MPQASLVAFYIASTLSLTFASLLASMLRYWVVARAAPGVAAQDAPDGKQRTLDWAMLA